MGTKVNTKVSPGREAPPKWTKQLRLGRYTVAFLSVGIAFSIRYVLIPLLGEDLPLMLFVAAALVASWYGGASAGGASLVLGLLLAHHFFMSSAVVPEPLEKLALLRFTRYFVIGVLGISLIEILHRRRRQMQAVADELKQEIARRKASEEALREAKQVLDLKVAQRTSELAATVESLEAVLYQIAHSLRAPIRAIAGYTSLVIEEFGIEAKPGCRAYLEQVYQAAGRMDVLIRDLLEYGRLGHMKVELSAIPLRAPLEQAVSRLQNEVSSLGGEIGIIGSLPIVLADKGVLLQVFNKLLQNALKFGSPGTSPMIRIWGEDRGDVIRIWVADNGIGIEPKYHDRIFNMFEKIKPSDWSEGTGMGLAIVKQGMKRLGGRAGVESQMNRGSQFWVELQKPWLKPESGIPDNVEAHGGAAGARINELELARRDF